jgi:hypothetical protein
MNSALQTFTENSLDDILNRGGDHDWVLAQDRAKKCKFLVCCSSKGANQKTSFLVGKISGTEFTYTGESGKDRYLVTISEYASIDIPNSWNGQQNPVRYTSLEELGIDLNSLNFEKISKPESTSFTIAQAKAGLAKNYGISEDNIEIIIKG